MHNILLKATNISKTYREGDIENEVLINVNLNIFSEEITAIVGKSGSGKSTLLHILGTLDTPTKGIIQFDNKSLSYCSDDEKANFRNQKLGFIYQFHHLLSDFTALENVMMPLLISKLPEQEVAKRAKEYLCKVGLEERMSSKPSELSGGERQRVAIARALVNKPKLVLADEPTGNLDSYNANEIFTLFSNLAKEEKTAVVMVTHDEQLARKCDRIYTMKNGVIICE